MKTHQKKWFCVGEDVESTQEISGTPEANSIDTRHCIFAKTAKEAYKKWMENA